MHTHNADQLDLDLLPAGELAHVGVAVEHVRRNAQLSGQRGQFPIVRLQKGGVLAEKLIDRFCPVRRGQFLGQIAAYQVVFNDLSVIFRVILHQSGVIQQFQQSGFAVPLFSDDGGLVPVVYGEGKVRCQRTQILFMINI